MIRSHDAEWCSVEIIDHLAQIEAGWTLRKPWKSGDTEEAEAENWDGIHQMLLRWYAHGFRLVDTNTGRRLRLQSLPEDQDV